MLGRHKEQKSLLLVFNNGILLQWINAVGATADYIKKFTLPLSVNKHFSIVCSFYWANSTTPSVQKSGIVYISNTQIGVSVEYSGSHAVFVMNIAI